jgi:hypothetical protein
MYARVTISGVEFEVEYSQFKPEFDRESGMCSFPGDIEIDSVEINGADVHELLCNNAPNILEKIIEKL